ncbi:MAG: HD domain-containing protein [Phycisphaerae bacterium]|nr:HD domain-containing protein [Phycisphaerae bacterium]
MNIATEMFDAAVGTAKRLKPVLLRKFIKTCKRDLKLFLGRNRKDNQVLDDARKILRATALCHDIGHFPLSHTLERAFKKEFWQAARPSYIPSRAIHEMVSVEIVRHIIDSNDLALAGWLGRAVILVMLAPGALSVSYGKSNLPFAKTMFSTLNAIIMGDYDADRLDYIQRDGYFSGSGFGHFDVRRFIDAMTLTENNGGFRLIPSSRALSTIEAALVERYKLYKWVYFHHKVLFLDEITCESARKIFTKPDIKAKLFQKHKMVVDDAEYRRSVFDALSSPEKSIPPLVLFDGKEIGLTKGFYKLNVSYFIGNRDSYFFDDIWFCTEFRKNCKLGTQGKRYKQALLDRSPCGITVWKDWSQFGKFRHECLTQLNDSGTFADKTGTDEVANNTSGFLKKLWQIMREGDFSESVFLIMAEEGRKMLKKEKVLKKEFALLVRVADWGLFGNLREKQILGRTGKPGDLVEHSALLKELSNLRGEIPFYVFVVGETADIQTAKKDKEMPKKLLTFLAKAFTKAIVNCWDESEELKQAWASMKGI